MPATCAPPDTLIAKSIRRSDVSLARRSKGLKLQATDQGVTSHLTAFQKSWWLNVTRLLPRAASARLRRICLEIRRPVTRRYTARRDSDDRGRHRLPRSTQLILPAPALCKSSPQFSGGKSSENSCLTAAARHSKS
jgi:hypothetical protein